MASGCISSGERVSSVWYLFSFLFAVLLLVFFVAGTVRTWSAVGESAGMMGGVEVSTIGRCPIIVATGIVTLDAKCKSDSRE